MNETNITKAIKSIPPKQLIILGLLTIGAIGGIAEWANTAYHKHAIKGNWKCERADGSFAGVFEFGNDDYFLETESRTTQFYGDYSVSGSTIKTNIIGSTLNVSDNQLNSLGITFDFIEKNGDTLILKAWPRNKPMGVALSCEPFNT